MPHLKAMHWDNNGWLTHVELDESGNNAYYVYDGSGERVRKIVEKRSISKNFSHASGSL
jgi:hypothetical protein